jgi:hypothetical protein
LWQQSSFYSCDNKYISQTNCENSSCDWFSYPLDCQYNADLGYNCGQCISFWNCPYYPSDVSLKSGIETLKNVLSAIMEIEAVEYDWNDNLNPTLLDYFKKQQKLHTIGLIAQNVRMYFPEAVKMNDDGYYSIDYHKLNAVLVEGIKEQQIFIEDIDKQLEYIESKIK